MLGCPHITARIAAAWDKGDDRATAEILFELLNLVAEQLVSLPKRVADVYGKLPDRDRQAIAKRDGISPAIPKAILITLESK